MNMLRVLIEKAPDFAISRSEFEGVEWYSSKIQ